VCWVLCWLTPDLTPMLCWAELALPRNGHSKGIAFIDYQKEEDAAVALIKTDGTKLKDGVLEVCVCVLQMADDNTGGPEQPPEAGRGSGPGPGQEPGAEPRREPAGARAPGPRQVGPGGGRGDGRPQVTAGPLHPEGAHHRAQGAGEPIRIFVWLHPEECIEIKII
jgi:hypothetical protein